MFLFDFHNNGLVGLHSQHELNPKKASLCLFTGVIKHDMKRASPLQILGLTWTLAQSSVHMFLSVPDLTAHSGNPVNVTACPVMPLVLSEAVAGLFLTDQHK